MSEEFNKEVSVAFRTDAHKSLVEDMKRNVNVDYACVFKAIRSMQGLVYRYEALDNLAMSCCRLLFNGTNETEDTRDHTLSYTLTGEDIRVINQSGIGVNIVDIVMTEL